MKKLFYCILLFLTTSLFGAIDKNMLFVVANSNDANSLELAREYCAMREIPKKNIIEISIPKNNGYLSRADYFKHLENPLMEALVKKGALSAFDLNVFDSLGRREIMLTRVNLDFLVLCKGIPWGILEEKSAQKVPFHSASAACVDSEISARFLKPKNNNVFGGFLKNPAFAQDFAKWRSSGVIRVARLDGASFEDVKNMLSKTMLVEQNGLRGRAYIDKSRYAELGDKWLDVATKVLSEAGFDVSVDSAKPVMGLDSRMDGVAFYFGWYSTYPCGYFAIPKFALADGAIGWHIFSYSARSFTKNQWSATFVAKNSALTDGNVFEPYLALTRNIGVFTKLLFSSENLLPAEVAFASLMALSWQNTYLGDPLYNPFKKNLDAQLKDIEVGKIDNLSQYVIIRKANLIEKQSGKTSSLNFLRKYIGKIPDIALIWKIAQLSDSGAEKLKLASALFYREFYKDINYVGLAFEVAKSVLEESPKDALAFYEAIFYAQKNIDSIARAAAKKAELASEKCGIPVSEDIRALLNKMAREEIVRQEKARQAKAKKAKADKK